MNKMVWILIWGLTALMARRTNALQCHACNSFLEKLCNDPFLPLVPIQTCPDGTTQCFKIKAQAKDKSGAESVVLRGCAAQKAVVSGCLHEEQNITRADGTQYKEKGDVCLCGKDLCNEGEKFQPKLKLVMIAIAMSTALKNILFN